MGDPVELPPFVMTASEMDARGWSDPFMVSMTPDGIRCRVFKHVNWTDPKTGDREYRLFAYKIQS